MNLKTTIIWVGLLIANMAVATSAEETWNKLVGQKKLKHSGELFKFVKNNPELPNIFIYGDSISMGYTPGVRKNLDKKANVYRLFRNGGTSRAVIRNFKRLQEAMTNSKLSDPWKFKWNIITINVGLHDLKYRKNNKPATSIQDYKSNLIKIIKYFQKTQSQAKLIYVMTTPVPAKSVGRVEGDAVKYNDAAREVLKKYPEIKICDLYTLTKANHKKWWIKQGNVHYNSSGKLAQAQKVSEAIEAVLEK